MGGKETGINFMRLQCSIITRSDLYLKQLGGHVAPSDHWISALRERGHGYSNHMSHNGGSKNSARQFCLPRVFVSVDESGCKQKVEILRDLRDHWAGTCGDRRDI